jgi:DNA mismatch repair protein MutL
MSKIRLLSETVANQIAAGEVVERPASVAKELLENSLDAGATRVDVVVEQGGKSVIQIRDDGEGMSRDDALLAFERHATSKIRAAEDLQAVRTFGFRGEALASIASVARIALFTKLHAEVVGTEVDIQGGKIQRVRDAAWPGGTEITVRDLFFNVPARRKFLKSEATESFHIANLVTHYALANPERSFSLRHNGRETLNVSSASDLRARAYQLFGERLLDEMTEIRYVKGDMSVFGFTSHPHLQRTSRDGQYLFVNGRFVKDRTLGRAISQAYRSLMPAATYPSVLLFLEMPPEEVDVNVHPQKTEVRFRLHRLVQECVTESVRSALSERRPFAPFPTSIAGRGELRRAADDGAERAEEEFVKSGDATSATRLDRNFRADLNQDVWTDRFQERPPHPAPARPTTELEDAAPAPPVSSALIFSCEPPQRPQAMSDGTAKGSLHRRDGGAQSDDSAQRLASILGTPAKCGSRLCGGLHRGSSTRIGGRAPSAPPSREAIRILGQMHNSYIVAADPEGLMIIDQHVAHERILFERRLRMFAERAVSSQRLLVPETIDLTAAQAEAFEGICSELEANGFDCRLVGRRTIAVQSVPSDLDAGEARTLLTELLAAVEDLGDAPSLEAYHRELAASLACRAAVKINMTLTAEKMEWLVDELFKTHNPTNCPHGRPVILRFALREIERGFHRI